MSGSQRQGGAGPGGRAYPWLTALLLLPQGKENVLGSGCWILAPEELASCPGAPSVVTCLPAASRKPHQMSLRPKHSAALRGLPGPAAPTMASGWVWGPCLHGRGSSTQTHPGSRVAAKSLTFIILLLPPTLGIRAILIPFSKSRSFGLQNWTQLSPVRRRVRRPTL